MQRRTAKQVMVGSTPIGGGAPIAIQSMTNTDTRDAAATAAQIQELTAAGCEIVRVAVPDEEAAAALPRIKEQIEIPLVADIHFDYRLALLALEGGVDKLRINPGNIGKQAHVREVAAQAKDRGVPIRVGVNSGSLPSWAIEAYGRTPEAMVEAALHHVGLLEKADFTDIVISMKATDIDWTVQAHELIAHRTPYPLHLGITEAGTAWFGTIKSACGLSALLSRGLGDTLRVSLTADPVEEVRVAWAILMALRIRQRGPLFISCPTCGRTQIPLQDIAEAVEKRLSHITAPLTIAVMGCAVNGPGEARDADLGIAGGSGVGLLFRRGQVIRRVSQEELVDALVEEAERLEDC